MDRLLLLSMTTTQVPRGRLCYRARPTLRHTREQLGRSIRDVATAAGITAGHLSRIERGDKNATIVVAYRIAEAINTTAGELFDAIRTHQ